MGLGAGECSHSLHDTIAPHLVKHEEGQHTSGCSDDDGGQLHRLIEGQMNDELRPRITVDDFTAEHGLQIAKADNSAPRSCN
jgi:hypothetical protein